MPFLIRQALSRRRLVIIGKRRDMGRHVQIIREFASQLPAYRATGLVLHAFSQFHLFSSPRLPALVIFPQGASPGLSLKTDNETMYSFPVFIPKFRFVPFSETPELPDSYSVSFRGAI
jgi:hypothetical protein